MLFERDGHRYKSSSKESGVSYEWQKTGNDSPSSSKMTMFNLCLKATIAVKKPAVVWHQCQQHFFDGFDITAINWKDLPRRAFPESN